MPSAKQIAARKKFVKNFAKKGKRKAKSKKKPVPRTDTQKIVKYESMKKAGYTDKEVDAYFDREWDKKMQEFLNKSNNES